MDVHAWFLDCNVNSKDRHKWLCDKDLSGCERRRMCGRMRDCVSHTLPFCAQNLDITFASLDINVASPDITVASIDIRFASIDISFTSIVSQTLVKKGIS